MAETAPKVDLIKGEDCHKNINKCFNHVIGNYFEVKDTVNVKVYKKTGNYNGGSRYNPTITTLHLEPKTKVHLGPCYLDPGECSGINNLKCRAEKATTSKIVNMNGYNLNRTESLYTTDNPHHRFVYQVGKRAIPDDFTGKECFDRLANIPLMCSSEKICDKGIRFFLRKSDADAWK